MKKRIAALILACVLMTVPVLAAENTADNFTRTRTYAGEFSDLTSDSPFYENVTALYEYGLTVGKGDGTFGLTDTMTVGQIVILPDGFTACTVREPRRPVRPRRAATARRRNRICITYRPKAHWEPNWMGC